GEEERRQAEESRKPGDQSLLDERAVNVFRQSDDLVYRQVGFDLLDRSPDRGNDSARRAGETNYKVVEIAVFLGVRVIGHGRGRFIQAPVFGVARDADDLDFRAMFGRAQTEAFAERRLTREKPLRHRLADHSHPLRLFGIRWPKAAAL